MHALHKTGFIFCALVGFALGAEIIDGEETNKNAMQYMASVQNKYGHVCGGFLINERFVLTAAHCVKKNLTHVVLGTHNLENVDKKNRYPVKTCKHRDFWNVASGDDIMLLRLSRKAKLERGTIIKHIDLPSHRFELNKKKKCRVAGWGPTKTGGKIENKLRDVEVPVVDLKTCRRLWRNMLPEKVICAGGNNREGFCQGDSGGPLVCDDQAVGIVSFNNGTCDYFNDVPNVYTDVYKYIPWIKKNMKRCYI